MARSFVRWVATAMAVTVALSCVLATAAAADTACGFTTQRVQCGDLACDKDRGICIRCRSTADCYPEGMTCDTASGKCEVRSFVSLVGWRVILSMLGAFLVCSIAVLAGVGGGGILVPMFTGLIQLPMQSSVGLSQSTICGQSTLNMYLAVQKKFPDPNWDRPLINYQYLSLLLPLGLIGTLLGGLLSKVCPDLLRLLLLFVLLSAVLFRTVKKMQRQYVADKEAKEVAIELADDPPHPKPSGTAGTDAAVAAADSSTSPTVPTKASQPQYPKRELAMNFASFLILLTFNTMRSYCRCGGALYWMCVAIPLVLLSMIFYHSRDRLRKLSEECPEMLEFAWNEKNSVTYPMVAIVAGAAAAMLGIGGGLVLGFVLYEVGLTPEEASVTGGMATFFIAFSSTLQLLVTGHLVIDFGIVFYLVGMASTALGQNVFMTYIKAHGLSFLIVGSLALVVGGSLVVLGGYGISNAIATTRSGDSIMAFGKFCTH